MPPAASKKVQASAPSVLCKRDDTEHGRHLFSLPSTRAAYTVPLTCPWLPYGSSDINPLGRAIAFTPKGSASAHPHRGNTVSGEHDALKQEYSRMAGAPGPAEHSTAGRSLICKGGTATKLRGCNSAALRMPMSMQILGVQRSTTCRSPQPQWDVRSHSWRKSRKVNISNLREVAVAVCKGLDRKQMAANRWMGRAALSHCDIALIAR